MSPCRKRSSSARRALSLLALGAAAFLPAAARAQSQPIGPIFVIDLENRNFTQPTSVNATLSPLLGNAAAPYINSLVTPGNANAQYVSYGTAYHNVLAGPTGPVAPSQAWAFTNNGGSTTNLDIHPSEPNYLWQEAGINFGKYDDNDPYGSGASVNQIANYLAANPAASGQHLTGLLQAAGISWKSYQEGIDLQTTTGTNGNLGGTITSTVAPTGIWTVPLASFSGTSTSYTNPYNGSHQYNFACKHDGTLFFSDTNGTTSLTVANTSTTNPEVPHYAPLEQLATDLANNTVASYNLITPDQFNDMHTALTGGFTYNGTHYAGDLAQVAQGDNFLAMIVPRIMASAAFQNNNGVIIIWTDETEGANQDAFTTTLEEIVISKLAVGNAYNVTTNLTHSSDVATLQEIYGVRAATPTGFLNDAANAANGSGGSDLAPFFLPGVIPTGALSTENTPAMPPWALAVLAGAVLVIGCSLLRRRAEIV